MRVLGNGEQAAGYLGHGTRADGLDGVAIEIVLHERLGLRGRCGIELGDEIGGQALDGRSGHGAETLQLGAESLGTPELRDKAMPPALGNVDGIKQRIEEAEIADPQFRCLETGRLHGLERAQEHLGIGLGLVDLRIELDTGLAELARVRGRAAARLIAEDRAVVAVARGDIGIGMALEVDARRRHSEVGAQAQHLAVLVREHVRACTQALADDVEEDVRRLDDRRRDALVRGLVEDRHDDRGLRLECLEAVGCFNCHLFSPPAAGKRPCRPTVLHGRRKIFAEVSCQSPECRSSTPFTAETNWSSETEN